MNFENTLPPETLPVEPYSASSNPPLRSSGQMGAIERQEDQLRDVRERLLGSRFKLKDQRGELRDLRQKTGLAEGAIIDQLRIVFQDRNIDFPVELEIAFARALTLRDSLGSLEGTYEEEEEKYNDLEWDCTKKEENYLTGLISHNGNAMDAANNARSDDATLYAPVPRDNDISPTGFPDLRPDVFMRPFQISEAALQMFEEHSSSNIPKAPRSTFGYDQPGEGTDIYSSLPRTSSETSTSQAHLDWNRIKMRVDTWILDSVSCSQYQKLVLKSLFSKDDVDDATWWNLVTQQWNSESPSTPPTGMNAEDSLYISLDTPHLPVAERPIVASRNRVDTECHEAEEVSQEHLMLDDEQDVHAQSIGKSSPKASSNPPGHKPQARNMEVAGLQIVVPSKPQESVEMLHRHDDSLEVVTSLERLPAKSQTINPELGNSQLTIQKQISDPNQETFAILLENNTTGNTIDGFSPQHHRHWSNPELQRRPTEIAHPKHHEDPASEFRPHSPDLDSVDNALRQGIFLTPYRYRRPISPPRTRSQSCTRSLSVQSRPLQAFEHINHDANLQSSLPAAKGAFPESAYAFRSTFATAYERQAQSLAVMCPVAGFTNFRCLGVLVPIL